MNNSNNPANVPNCPVCGLSAQTLHDTGRMGCAACYDAFSEMVARAVTKLHHSTPNPAPAPPLSDRTPNDNPWPTRRGR